ncbi:uncharacterized protein Sap-r [Dermacentor andersoni]|uniref:uncharacterized protein Sap-r n=1 Tax=Dermacentor andersoni TaxID=34620 RepID=UPI003B3B7FAD
MFARVLLAASIICLTSAVPLVKPSDKVCQTLSTSCQDLWVASSCKTVKPCIEMIWEKLEVPMDKSSVCNICKEMVKEARDQLLSNETQEELREVLEGSCALIPIEFVSKLCKDMVDNFIPDLIDILVSRLDPDQVCTIAGLCNPDFVTRKLQNLLEHKVFMASMQSRLFLPLSKEGASASSAKKEATCAECKTAMKHSRELFKKLPLAGVKSAALKACQGRLGTADPECSTLVNVFLPSVFKYLQSLNPEEFCAYVDRCKAPSPPKLSIPPITAAKDNLTCDFCKQLVEHVRQILASNTTEQEFKQALLNFCEELGAAAEECQSFVDDYFDMVYSYLLEALDPNVFCSTIGLCSANRMKSEEKALNKLFIKAIQGALQQKGHLKNLKAAKKVKGYLEPSPSVPLIKVYPALPKKYFDNNKSEIAFPMVKTFPAQYSPIVEDIYTCSICKAFVALLEQVIPVNATVEDVKFVLDQICELFPAETEKNCRSFVDKNAEVILNFLAHDVAPAVICHEITLCMSLPPKAGAVLDSPDCEYCKITVEFFYDELKKKETEEEVKRIVEKLCQLFPSSSRDKCISTINTYVDMVISLVLQEFTPEQICQQLGFCASTNVSMPVVPPKKVSDDTCDLCMVVAKFVYDKVKDERTEEKVKEALDQVCTMLPGSLAQKCVDMVNTYYDMLVNLLLQELVPDQVCKELGLCPSIKKAGMHPVASVPSKKPTDEECDICQTVVQFVYNELKNNKTEEEVKQLLDRVCSLLPDSWKQTCTDTVNTYYDQLVELILQGFTPEQVCQELGLCPSAQRKLGATRPVKVASDETCVYCTTIVQYVYDALQDQKTEEMVKQALDEVCTLFHGDRRQECVNMVNTYFEVIVSLILQDFTPQQICQTIGLCPSSQRKLGAARPVKVASDETCVYCTTIVQYVYDALQDQKTEEMVKQALDEVCNLFHGDRRQECVNMVNTYFEVIVSLILQDFTPQQICQTIGLCPSSLGGNIECTFCQYALHFIQNELVDSKTEEKVEVALDKLCAKLPEDLAKECMAFVEEYGPAVMVLLAQEIDPSIVCVAVKACPKDGLKKQSDLKLKLNECASCTAAISYVEQVLKDTKNDQEVAKQLANACEHVPKTLQSQCKAVIETYGPALLQAIAQFGSGQKACEKLDICSGDTVAYKHQQKKLIGSNPCTRGPAHWCHSKENAAACKATPYCVKKVWKQ